MSRSQKATTQAQIARQAGISQAAVSAILSDQNFKYQRRNPGTGDGHRGGSRV